MPKRDMVLASASPRRKELLSLLIDDFSVVPSDFDESAVPADLGPADHVVYSAKMKARDVARERSESLVIGADTIVVVEDAILGKPEDSADAARMIQSLSGKTHQVYTGVAVVAPGVELTGYERTDVTFGMLSDERIARYVATSEPLDKAGAYAIQGKGAAWIRSVCGCYSNVVGLPLYKLSELLEECGVELL